MFRFLIVCLALFVLGCGSSGNNYVVTGPVPNTMGATVALESVLAQSTVPANVVQIRARGTDRRSSLLFGPDIKPIATRIEWNDVPTEVTDFTLEYLDSQGQVVGLARVEVTLKAGEVFLITNPTIIDLSGGIVGFTITPSSLTAAKGTSATFTAVGTLLDGTTVDLSATADWLLEPASLGTVEGGRVTTAQVGTGTVQASYSGRTASAGLEVTDAQVVSLKVTTSDDDVPAQVSAGATLQLKAVATFTDDSTQNVTEDATWTSSSDAIATVEDGLVTGQSPGPATFTATYDGQSDELQVTIQTPPLELTSGNYSFNTDTGVLSPQIGPNSVAPGWDAQEKELVLESFQVGSGAVLNVSGSVALKVKTDGDITIAGTIDFSGTNGSPGLNSTSPGPGQNGSPGGDIDLFAGADLTVSGTVIVNGGRGGDGGSASFGGEYDGNAVGGAGGHGGQSGEIVLVADGDVDTNSADLQDRTGDGGHGGSVSFFQLLGSCTGGQGGNGYNGGNGGAVLGSSVNFGTAVGGNGGHGDHRGGQGGHVSLNDQNRALARGGNGGNGDYGGNGGNISLIVNFQGTGVQAVGGNGGNGLSQGGHGGSASCQHNNDLTLLAGGHGGAGHLGGDGGDAEATASNVGTVAGGNGGSAPTPAGLGGYGGRAITPGGGTVTQGVDGTPTPPPR